MIVNTANKCRCCLTFKTVERIEILSPGLTLHDQGFIFESEQMIYTDVDAGSGFSYLDIKITFSDGSTKEIRNVIPYGYTNDMSRAFLTLSPGSFTLTDDDIAESDRGVWSFVGVSFEGVINEKDAVKAWFFYEEGYFYPPVFGDGLWRRP